MIPLVDLKSNYLPLKNELEEAMAKVFDATAFIGGPEVSAFEKEYAAFVGAKHAIGVANGTDALELVVRAAGLGAGDTVLVPANSFIASALGVARAGAKVKLVDCDDDALLDLKSCEARFDSSVRAVMPVHLFGQCAPMEQAEAFAQRHSLFVLEDAAQAQGAKRHGKTAGTFGLAAGTSFYPGKNLGAYGDAGAVTTDSDEVAKKVKALRNYGSEVKYFHPELGFNSRLDTLQAAVLRVKLQRLAGWNEQRRAAAQRYHARLEGLPDVRLPRTVPGNEHIWHLYVVRVPSERRDAVLEKLHAAGVGAGVHYPVPIHLQGAFQHLGHRAGDFPVSERLAKEMISLPMYPELTLAQQEQVVAALQKAL